MARNRPTRQQVSRTYSLPAPTGGLNAIDALANMPETDAIVMDNFFPQPSYVELRNGFSNWVTGIGAWVDTLMPYSNGTTNKLFGIASTKVYDVTSSGAVGAAVVTSLSNARWEWVNFATSGGQFLYAGNATDKPLYYDGTSWVKVDSGTTPAITGVTTTLLRSPAVWKSRIWWIENNTLHAWYLPTASVGGAASEFDLSPIFRLGGNLQAIITASLSDGSTFDEYIAFLTNQGELALYRGTDPAQAGLFYIVGVYRIGTPIGRRCWFRLGSDTVILCSDGFVSMQEMISIGRVSQKGDISYKILNLVNADVQSYGSNFGWQGLVYPIGNKVIINVPEVVDSVSHQYVMNTITGSWCRFTGWNASSFCVLGDVLYFGGNGVVAKADSGSADNTTDINGLMKTAFSYLGTDRQKMFTMVRVIVQANGDLSAVSFLNTDFDNQLPTSAPVTSVGTGSPWNTSPWNTSPWAPGYQLFKDWQGIYGVGFSASLYYSIKTNAIQAKVQAIDYCFQDGGVL